MDGNKSVSDMYWIVRYKKRGKRQPVPILTSMRDTRHDCLHQIAQWGQQDWNELKQRLDLECVKVQLLDAQDNQKTVNIKAPTN